MMCGLETKIQTKRQETEIEVVEPKMLKFWGGTRMHKIRSEVIKGTAQVKGRKR